MKILNKHLFKKNSFKKIFKNLKTKTINYKIRLNYNKNNYLKLKNNFFQDKKIILTIMML
jgi:hypothetical protein